MNLRNIDLSKYLMMTMMMMKDELTLAWR